MPKVHTILLGTALALILSVPTLSATPKYTLIVAKNLDEVLTLDPAESFEQGSGEIIANLYAKLLTTDPVDGTKLMPQLSSSWTIDAEGKVFTFKIRDGAKFTDGKPVTAEDAAYSLKRAILLDKTPSFILTQFGWTKENVDQLIRATDAHTLRIEVVNVRAPTLLLNALTASVAAIVEKSVVEAHAKDGDFGFAWLRTAAAGAGGFSLLDWKPKEAIALKANHDFYAGPPAVERVILRHVPEPSTQRLLLEKGDVDIARDLAPDQVSALGKTGNFTVWSSAKPLVIYLGLNQKDPVLANPKVWEALRWLVDYDGLATTALAGQYSTHQTFLTTGAFGALEANPYHLDIAKAKALLAEAGLANGAKLTINAANTMPYVEIAQSIQSTFAKAGITADIALADQKQVITKYRARGHDLVVLYWGQDYGDPHSSADFFTRNPDNSDTASVKTLPWRNSWDIPELTRLTDAAVIERDDVKRVADYHDLQSRIQTASPLIVLFQKTEVTVSLKTVHGYVSGNWSPTYWGVKKD